MRSLILLFVLATSIIATVKSEPVWRFELLNPKGFRLSQEAPTGLKEAFFGAAVYNKPYGEDENEEYSGELHPQSNGWWTFENRTALLTSGDKIEIVVLNFVEGHTGLDVIDDMVVGTYIVSDDSPRVNP